MPSLENTPFDRLAQRAARTKVGRVVLPALMIAGGAVSACKAPTETKQPVAVVASIATPTIIAPEAAHTPVGAGPSIPDECRTDPDSAKGLEIALRHDEPLDPANDRYIDAFNDCMGRIKTQAEVSLTQTAAKQEPIIASTATPTVAPTKETLVAKNCKIVDAEACAKAEYVQWDTPLGSPAEAIAMTLEAGKKFTITEPMQVAAVADTYQGKPYGYRIVAAKKDGSQITINGDVVPVGVGPIGKDLPAGTVIAESADSGIPLLIDNYKQFVHFTSKEDLEKQFPDQAGKGKLPKLVTNKAMPPSQPNNSTGDQGRGITLYGVNPPQS